MKLVYLGIGTAEVTGRFSAKLKTFGQRIEVPDSEVQNVLGDGGILAIPEEQFAAFHLADADLAAIQKLAATRDKEVPTALIRVWDAYQQWKTAGFTTTAVEEAH